MWFEKDDNTFCDLRLVFILIAQFGHFSLGLVSRFQKAYLHVFQLLILFLDGQSQAEDIVARA